MTTDIEMPDATVKDSHSKEERPKVTPIDPVESVVNGTLKSPLLINIPFLLGNGSRVGAAIERWHCRKYLGLLTFRYP